MKITILKVHYYQYATCKQQTSLLKTHALLAQDDFHCAACALSAAHII